MTVVFDGQFAGAEEALHRAATELAGHTDFGDETEYMPGLRRLLRALDEEVRFTPVGAQVAFGALLGPLAGRLRAVEGWKRHPDCLQQPLDPPVMILGLPRTGTTALYHLLWLDPQFQGPEMWLIDAPMPRPARETWHLQPAYQASARSIAALLQAAPGFGVAHPRDPDLPDECLEILKQCFANNLWGTMFPVPGYDGWWPHQDHVRQYGYLYRVLQLIGAGDARRWLLKDPTSILHMPALMHAFPGTALIVTHRDPAEVVPSLCSLLRALHSLLLGDAADIGRIAEREIALWSDAANRLAREPLSSPRVDVHLRDFQSDPLRVVHDIYERLHLTLSPRVEQSMRTHIAGYGAASKPAHRYTLEEFGLDAKRIRAQFTDYIEHFRVLD